MKHHFVIYMNAVLLLMLTATSVQAQDTVFTSLPSVTITSTSKVSKELSNSFHSTFPDATDAMWYKADKNYLVRFITNDQTNRALFDKYGSLIYHIRYGNENNMPQDIRDLVKSRYGDYNISSVIFVNQEDRKIWVINIENAKSFLVLRSEEGELERVESFKKM